MTAYKLLKRRFEHAKGTICYRTTKYDYGLASDDFYETGIEHWSMSLKSDGDDLCFTVSVTDMAEVEG